MTQRAGFSTTFEGVRDALTRATERILGPTGRNILWESGQTQLWQAILSDATDAIPIVGEWFDAARTVDAARKGSQRTGAREAFLAIGTLPRPVGYILDFLTPIQTITWLERHGYSVADFPLVLMDEVRRTFDLPRIPGLEEALFKRK